MATEETIQKTPDDILKEEWGSNANAQKGNDGHWYDVSSGEAVRIDNADGTYNLPNNRVLKTDGNIVDASEYQKELNTPTLTSTEGLEGNLRQAKRSNRQAERQARWDNKARSLQEQYNELRSSKGDRLSYGDMDTYLRGEGIYAYQKANNLLGTGVINQRMIDKLEEGYLNSQNATSGNAMTSLFSDTRDENGRLKYSTPIAKIGDKEFSRSDSEKFAKELKIIADTYGLQGGDKFTPEAQLRINALVEELGIPVNDEIGGVPGEVFDSMDSLVEVLDANGAADFLDASGFDIDDEGNIRIEPQSYNVQELLDAQRAKKNEEVDLELARKKAERKNRALAMQDVFANIGNTIRAAYGANVYETTGGKEMANVNAEYQNKLNAYKAKMEALRQEKLAEQKAKEAEATRQRERAEDRKYQTDMFNANMNFETNKLKLNYLMHKDELDTKSRIAAANAYATANGKVDNIDTLTLGNRKIYIDKDTYKNNIGQLAAQTIGRYFNGTEELDLQIFTNYDPENPTKVIDNLRLLLEEASRGQGKIKLKDGVTKDDVIKDFDTLLVDLAFGEYANPNEIIVFDF